MRKGYCDWSKHNDLLREYHDREWGVPVFDDRLQFEYLMLEALQCGLSWSLMLKKREIFRNCFDDFDYEKIARYTQEDALRILNTDGMIRSIAKINAVIQNARCFLEIRHEFGTFSNYIWSFSGGKTIIYNGHEKGAIPAANGLSETVAKDLKKRGFRYLGAVTVYSHLQACGIINDHDEDCPCHQRLVSRFPTVRLAPDRETKTVQYRPIEVVAALIWDGDKFMICQRPEHKARGLLWEFVGGKVEAGETKQEALIRECMEELAVRIDVGNVFMDVVHEYPDITVHLTLFHASVAEGVVQKLEHNDIRFIRPSELGNYDFCPADVEILKKIKATCGGKSFNAVRQ